MTSSRLTGLAVTTATPPLLHLAYGALLLAAAPNQARPGSSGSELPQLAVAARLLGGRHLLQGAAALTAPELVTPRRAAAIDTLHALSMLAIAASTSRYRRPAVISALLDGLLAGLSVTSHALTSSGTAVRGAHRAGRTG